MVSALDSGWKGPFSNPGQVMCRVLGQDTLLSQYLSTREYKWVAGN